VGVLADLSGQPETPLPRLKDRKFVEIDRDNFTAVMKGMQPHLALKVDNTVATDDSTMGVELRFNSLDDFEPEQVARQVGPLRKLLDVRQQLRGLLAKTDGNDRLAERLQEIIANTELLHQVRQEAGNAPAGDTDASKPPLPQGEGWGGVVAVPGQKTSNTVHTSPSPSVLQGERPKQTAAKEKADE